MGKLPGQFQLHLALSTPLNCRPLLSACRRQFPYLWASRDEEPFVLVPVRQGNNNAKLHTKRFSP